MLHTADEAHARRAAWPVRVATLAILLGALALRLVALDRQDIWWDEARNIDVALRPFLSIANAPELDIHPPVYFWSLHLWARWSGLSRDLPPEMLAFGARMFSAAAGVGGVALLYALASRVMANRTVANRSMGVIAALIGAASPFWLAESQETRMYTLAFLWLTAAAICLLDVAQEHTRRVLSKPFAGLVVFSALALLTHYNAAFILVSWYLWWGAAALFGPEPLRRIRMMLGAGAATVALAAPVAPIALRQIPGYANPNLIVPTVADYLAQNWRAYSGGYAFDPAMLGGLGTGWLWGSAFVLVTGVALAALHRGGLYPLGFLLVWLAGGLALYYIAVLDRGAFNVRYASFVTPALYALLAVAVWAWRRVVWLAGALALVVVLAGSVPAVRGDLYDARFDREDVRGLAEWLRNHAGPEDVIFVDQKYPFGFYYGRYAIDADAASEPMPEGNEPAPARYLFVDINTIDSQLNKWAAEARQVFWVQWFESDTDPRRAVSFLLDQEGQRGGEQSFQGYEVDWWVLEPPSHFDLASGLEPRVIRFPPAVETVEVSVPQEALGAGGNVPVVIRWRRTPGGAVTRPLKARVALYNAEGGRLAQSDPRLLNDRHLLPAEWSAEDTPLNVYMLETPDDLAAGEYELRLLVYDADTLEPLEIVDDAGNPAGIEASLGRVMVQSAD